MMTFNEMLDQGIEFQTEVHLCYYSYSKQERVEVTMASGEKLFLKLANQPIRYIYTDKESAYQNSDEIYIEVENPFEEEEEE